MKLSILVPIYNVSKYLTECLDSLQAQTVQDMEIICINDASTDRSVNILEEYQKIDDRFVIISNQKSAGPSVARNKGIELARGKYILFVDSDDFVAPNLLKETVEYAEKEDLEELHFNYEIITGKEWNWQSCVKKAEAGIYYRYKSGREMLVEKNNPNSTKKTIMTVWSCLFNRNYLNNNNLRFYDGILHEDCLFYFKRCFCVERVAKVNKPYYFYRKREDSITTGKR